MTSAWCWTLIILSLFGLLVFFFGLMEELFSRTGKYILDIISCLGRSFEDFVDAVIFGELNCPIELDFSLIFHFWLVSDEINLDILCSVLLYLLEPLNKISECLISSNIISQKYTMGAPIKDPSNRPKRLLSSLYEKSLELLRYDLPCPRSIVLSPDCWFWDRMIQTLRQWWPNVLAWTHYPWLFSLGMIFQLRYPQWW